MDTVVARKWRSPTHEDLYLNGADGGAAQDGISLRLEFSPGGRLHQALGYRARMPGLLTPFLRRPFHHVALDGTFG